MEIEPSINNPDDIKDALKYLDRGLTMKGALVSFAILNADKNIENRPKTLKSGWYALHTGSGKIDASLEELVLKKFLKQ
jgi:hypothetical protein